MTIVTEYREILRLNRARRQPNLPLMAFSVSRLIDDARRLIPAVHHRVRLKFVSSGPLACVAYDETDATIYIHQLLNHHDTPPEVMSMIVKHELLHLWIPPALVDGKETDHPPEYRAAEVAITPELNMAWLWIDGNFAACVKRRPELERIDVLPGWRQEWSRRRISIEECQAFAHAAWNYPHAVSGDCCDS